MSRTPPQTQPRILLFCLLIVILSTELRAQQVDFAIDPPNLSSKYLTYLVKLGIDSVRNLKKLTPLQFDSHLEAAAQDHALYLLSNPNAGHYQKIQNKRSVADRIDFYGGSFKRTGENIQQSSLIEQINLYKHIDNYTFRNGYYRQTARNIVAGWVSSPPHYKNLLQTDFRFTGVAIGYDTLSNVLRVVQVFSDQGTYDASYENIAKPSAAFQYLNTSLKTKPGVAKRGRNLELGKEWLNGTNDYQGWIATKRKSVKRAFRWYHFRTKLLIETTSIGQFEDDRKYHVMPSRINQQHSLQDSLGCIVTRGELMRLLKEMPKEQLKIVGIKTPIKVRPKVAFIQIPWHWGEGKTKRMVMVRKGRICDVIPVVPYPGKRLSPKFPKLPFLLPQFGKKPDETINYKGDSVYYEIYYKRNVTTLQGDDQLALLNLIPENSKVKKIKILAHASVEGSQAINENIFQTRADQILKFLDENDALLSGASLELETRENWPLMEEQISSTPELSDLQGKGKEVVRAYMNRNVNDSLCTELLQRQRYARVSLEFEDEQKKHETPAETLSLIKTTLAKKVLTQADINKVVLLQRKYYHLLAGLGRESENELYLPDSISNAMLRYQAASFKASQNSIMDNQIHDMMVEIANMPGLPDAARAMCVNHHKTYLANELFRSGNQTLLDGAWNCPIERAAKLNLTSPKKHNHNPNKLPPFLIALDMIPELVRVYRKHSEYRAMTTQMDLFYLVMKAQALLDLNSYQVLPSVQALSHTLWLRHRKSFSLNDELTIEYALFFSLTYQPAHALELLKPLVERPSPNPQAWMIWLSLNQKKITELQLERELIKATSWMPVDLWLELIESEKYLSLSLLERPKLRQVWQKKRLEWNNTENQ
jgi:hypothetical protein